LGSVVLHGISGAKRSAGCPNLATRPQPRVGAFISGPPLADKILQRWGLLILIDPDLPVLDFPILE
jgi:hypothetical protein